MVVGVAILKSQWQTHVVSVYPSVHPLPFSHRLASLLPLHLRLLRVRIFAWAGDTSPRRPSSACVSAWELHARAYTHLQTHIHTHTYAWHEHSTRFQRIRRNTTPADGTFRRVHARWGGEGEARSTTPSSNILNFFRLPSAHGCALTTLSEFATKRATTRRPAMLLYRYDTFFLFFFLMDYVGWRGKATPRCGWFLGVSGNDLC